MFGKIIIEEEEKGLFTFYKQLEEQEDRINGESQQQSIHATIHAKNEVDKFSSISDSARNFQKKSSHRYQKRNSLKKKTTQQSHIQQLLAEHQRAKKFLQHCIGGQRRSITTKTNNNSQIRKSIAKDQQEKTITVRKQSREGDRKMKEKLKNMEKLHIHKNNDKQNKKGNKLSIPSIVDQANSYSYSYSLEIPKISHNKITAAVLNSLRSPLILSHRNRLKHRKTLENEATKRIDSTKERQKLLNQLNLPQIPQSILTTKRKRKKNTKYTEKSQSYPYLSMIKVENLENDLVMKSIPALINMNYHMPSEVLSGWSNRKREIFDRIFNHE